MGKEVELLEDHADLGPYLVNVGLPVGQINSVDDDMSLGEVFKAVDAAEESGFPRPGRADDDHDLAPRHINRHPIHGPDHARFDREDLYHILRFNH